MKKSYEYLLNEKIQTRRTSKHSKRKQIKVKSMTVSLGNSIQNSINKTLDKAAGIYGKNRSNKIHNYLNLFWKTLDNNRISSIKSKKNYKTFICKIYVRILKEKTKKEIVEFEENEFHEYIKGLFDNITNYKEKESVK